MTYALVQALALAKSRQDIPAALDLPHPDMLCAQSGVSTDAVRRKVFGS
ncbi:hypothetical protein [Amycolatopsis sp. BJA-103]|nr:hypothetical protein [Amycolatopsis sp. BJA-103]